MNNNGPAGKTSDTLYDDLVNAVHKHPDRIACVGLQANSTDRITLTYRELKEEADKFAAGLQQFGIGHGDVVSVQLPNIIEFAIIAYAIFKVGAILNGITSIFRHREVEFILGRTESKMYIIPSSFRGFDYVDMASELKPRLNTLKYVVTVDNVVNETIPWLLSMKQISGETFKNVEVISDDLAQLAFTSGTTGEPKGVMHTHYTLKKTAVNFTSHVKAPEDFVNLIVSPVGHQTGFLWGTILSVYLAGTAVYLDIWNPEAACRAIQSEHVTTMVAAAPFLRDLVENRQLLGRENSLSMIAIPGAPIPRALVPQAEATLQCRIVPAWGMTEYGIALAVGAADPETFLETDGRPVPGAKVRVVDHFGKDVATGEEGNLQVQGEGLFIGYYKRPDITEDSFSEGWFKTGDRAVMSSDGCISITGRSKDIIVRGGENVPVQDIENVLYRWPEIQDVAIVAMPDARLGERACAYVVPAENETPSLDSMRTFLSDQGLTKQFWPERIEIVGQLPRTASGKVQKYRLREDIRKKTAN